MSGSWVFATGSQAWSWGLGRPNYVNSGIQQMATNLFNRFITNVPVAVTPTPPPPPAPSAYRSAVTADTPAGYWRLGEASGTVARDQRATHDGTYAYSPTLGQPGALFNDPATSVGFDGTTQYVQVPTDASLTTSAFSFEVWARPTGGAGNYRGVITDRFFPQGWNLYLGTSGSWEFWINQGSGMVSIAGGSGALNTWSHVVGTYDGTTASLYVNGVAVASAALSTTVQPNSRASLEIGQAEPGANLYFPGQIQDAAVYGTALSPAQVQRHYSVGTTGN
jgi:hypothetical protein